MDVALVRAPNPSPYTLERHEHLDRRARPGLGRRPRPGDPRARRRRSRRRSRARRRGRDRAHARPPGPRRGRRSRCASALGGAAGRRPCAGRAERRPGRRRRASARSRALHVPGHAEDHLVFVAGGGAFTGDAVLGEGSVFIAPDGGSLGAYLDGLRRLRALGLARLYPGPRPRRRRIPRPSSTSTSPTGSSASAGSSPRWERRRAHRRGAARGRLGRDPAGPGAARDAGRSHAHLDKLRAEDAAGRRLIATRRAQGGRRAARARAPAPRRAG